MTREIKLERSEKQRLDVIEEFHRRVDGWIQDQVRRRNKLWRKLQDVEIVVQMRASAAVPSSAQNAWMTLPIMAYSTNVLAFPVGQEYVRGRVDLLGASLEAPAKPGQCREIKVVRNRHQYVGILWSALVCEERAKQGDTLNPWDTTRGADKLKRETQ